MDKKIRVISIEKGSEGAGLFRTRLEHSDTATLVDSVVYRTGAEEEIHSVKADLVAVDVNLSCDVPELIARIRKVTGLRVMVTCDFVQPDLIYDCLRAGASGYVERYTDKKRFDQAIRDCVSGEILLPLSILGLLSTRSIFGDADAALKNILRLLANGFLLPDVSFRTGYTEQDIKRSIFLTLHN